MCTRHPLSSVVNWNNQGSDLLSCVFKVPLAASWDVTVVVNHAWPREPNKPFCFKHAQIIYCPLIYKGLPQLHISELADLYAGSWCNIKGFCISDQNCRFLLVRWMCKPLHYGLPNPACWQHQLTPLQVSFDIQCDFRPHKFICEFSPCGSWDWLQPPWPWFG